ncbi:MAG: hypothetical protein PHX74_10765 [Candidatus Sumerlaeales bacterium]|nr:hypothetical protein [Candidatus Sumerlaeales bacterium]
MKTQLGEQPKPFVISPIGDMAQVAFYENPVPVFDGEQWEVDMYILQVRNRPNLAATIEANYDAWLEMAKASDAVTNPPTVEERVAEVEIKTATIEETLDVLFGGIV